MGRIAAFILQVFAYAFALQPRSIQVFWGNLLGWVLWKLKLRESVARQNLNYAFPNNLPEQNRVLKASYLHLGNLIFEILILFGPLKKFLHSYVDVEGEQHIRTALSYGKGLIFLSSHVGNWEVMAGTGGELAQLDLMLVTKHLKPEWIHQAVERSRARLGVRATYEPKTLRDVLSQLKKNKVVGFVLDQYAGPPVGVRVPLFGVPVGTSLAVAALAKRTGATVLSVENFRKPNGRWTVRVSPPFQWLPHENPHRELAQNTALFAQLIEKQIYAHPEQWLWIHRRFKGTLTPLEESEWNEPRVRR